MQGEVRNNEPAVIMSQTGHGFWARLRENARSIVEKDYADLQKQTCPPEYCLTESDKALMRSRQDLLAQFNRDIQRLRQDGCRSRLLAIGTVLFNTQKYQ